MNLLLFIIIIMWILLFFFYFFQLSSLSSVSEVKGVSEQLHDNLLHFWSLPHLLMPLGAAFSQYYQINIFLQGLLDTIIKNSGWVIPANHPQIT